MSSQSSSLSSRRELEKRLAFHLGFEDGAGDVLEYLLTIESRTELLSYLQQLVGNENKESIGIFVADVERFRHDEPLSTLTLPASSVEEQLSSSSTASTKPPATQQKMAAAAPIKQLQEKKQNTPQQSSSYAAMAQSKTSVVDRKVGGGGGRGKPVVGGRGRGNIRSSAKQNASAKLTTASLGRATVMRASKPKQALTKKQTPTAGAASSQNQPIKEPTKEPIEGGGKVERVGPPPKGTASIVCGCYGTRHKPLTNCLTCGRISCEREGYDFCPFCSFLVEKPDIAIARLQDDKAWKLKEQLLQFDREHAQRTVILDDQADYFTNQTSAWLNEGEQENAKQQEQQRVQDLHYRKKQQLDLAL